MLSFRFQSPHELHQLPDTCQDVYMEKYGRAASTEVITHLRRELMQRVLALVLFQESFLEAYATGIPLDCSDGVKRRLFPRYMTYTADYPEK